LRPAEGKMARHGLRAGIPREAGHELERQVFGFSGIRVFGLCCAGLVAASRNHGEKEDGDREVGHGKFLSGVLDIGS